MSCFPACVNSGDISKSDLDRFTDTIENLLNNEIGRQHFKEFLTERDFDDGQKYLEVYENVLKHEKYDTLTNDALKRDILRPINRMDEFDEERLEQIEQFMDVDNLNQVLRVAKNELIRLLHHDYQNWQRAIRSHVRRCSHSSHNSRCLI